MATGNCREAGMAGSDLPARASLAGVSLWVHRGHLWSGLSGYLGVILALELSGCHYVTLPSEIPLLTSTISGGNVSLFVTPLVLNVSSA